MLILKRLISLILLLSPLFCYAGETIQPKEANGKIVWTYTDIDILNEELRSIRDGVAVDSPTITLSGDVTGSGTTAITASIGTDKVTADDIVANAVGASEIAANAVGSSEIAATAVTAGSYTNSSITVDADGRLTSASSGSGTNDIKGALLANFQSSSGGEGNNIMGFGSLAAPSTGDLFFYTTTNTYATACKFYIYKNASSDTVRVYTYMNGQGGSGSQYTKVTIGANNTEHTHSGADWQNSTINTSGLTDDTYNLVTVEIKQQNASGSSGLYALSIYAE